MAAETKIEWTDHTFNPWIGCTKVAPGCQNCYAEADMDKRRGRVKWGPQGTRSRTSDAYWKEPLKWNREAEKAGERRRVFCASLADVFEDWNGPIIDHNGLNLHRSEAWYAKERYVANDLRIGKSLATMNDLRRDLFALIDSTPGLDWLLLTKRPENVRRTWPARVTQYVPEAGEMSYQQTTYRPNVWIGTSVSNQETASTMLPHLLSLNDLSPCLFASAEPLLGQVILHKYFAKCECGSPGHGFTACPNYGGVAKTDERTGCKQLRPLLRWVIVGGESGPHARPCDASWCQHLINQCNQAGVACFMKQLGSKPFDSREAERSTDPHPGGPSIDPDCRLSLIDSKGGDIKEWESGLRVRQFPEVQR